MATLKIYWSKNDECFYALSDSCGLGRRGFSERDSGEYWKIPRDRAVALCEALDAEGAELVWLGHLAPYPG